MILRDSPSGPQVLLTRRPDNLRFMGGATVFPGGAQAAADNDDRWEETSARSSEEAGRLLDLPGGQARGAFVCALREAFEEVGFLIGTGPLEKLLPRDAEDPSRFLERCIELGIVLATDELTPAGRWVTPIGSPIRFDARFFLTRAPEGWEANPQPDEVAECGWTTPAEALTELGTGRSLMAPPTVEMLQRLDGHNSVTDVIEGLRARELDGPGRVLSTRLSPLVQVVLAPNPGLMTGPGTNTYIVGAEPALVIDPAVEDEEYLGKVLAAAGTIAALLVTHRHSDHVGGVRALTEQTGAPVRAFGSEPAAGSPVEPLAGGEVVVGGGAELVAVHTPGHASDHVCFHLPGTAGLFSGDTILGEGTAVIAPPDGDMAAYLDSLRRLRAMPIDRIFPGHFRPLNGGTAVIDDYLAHRAGREKAILEAVQAGRTSVDDIVEQVYTDTDPALHPVAAYSVRAHLDLLERRGLVRRADDRWTSN